MVTILVETRQIVIQKVENLRELTLTKHVKATVRSLFGGRRTGSMNMQLFYSKFEIGGETNLHDHEVESGHFILHGELQIVTDDGEKSLKANTAVFIPPITRHKFRNVSGAEAYMLSIFSPPEPMYET